MFKTGALLLVCATTVTQAAQLGSRSRSRLRLHHKQRLHELLDNKDDTDIPQPTMQLSQATADSNNVWVQPNYNNNMAKAQAGANLEAKYRDFSVQDQMNAFSQSQVEAKLDEQRKEIYQMYDEKMKALKLEMEGKN